MRLPFWGKIGSLWGYLLDLLIWLKIDGEQINQKPLRLPWFLASPESLENRWKTVLQLEYEKTSPEQLLGIVFVQVFDDLPKLIFEDFGRILEEADILESHENFSRSETIDLQSSSGWWEFRKENPKRKCFGWCAGLSARGWDISDDNNLGTVAPQFQRLLRRSITSDMPPPPFYFYRGGGAITLMMITTFRCTHSHPAFLAVSHPWKAATHWVKTPKWNYTLVGRVFQIGTLCAFSFCAVP